MSIKTSKLQIHNFNTLPNPSFFLSFQRGSSNIWSACQVGFESTLKWKRHEIDIEAYRRVS